MISVTQEGDIFSSRAHTWVNTVNTVGVMGKGIALGFKRRFPEMFEDYVERCRKGEVRLGEPYLYRRSEPPWILNFPTKGHWRAVARLADIIAGLEHVEENYRAWGVQSLAVPPLGCGEGGLEWRIVGPVLYQHLRRLAIPVELYAPFGTPHAELQPSHLEQLTLETLAEPYQPPSRVAPAWIALVEVLARIEREPYHFPVGRVGWQKLAYFATLAGVPTELAFLRGSYGPYSAGMKAMHSKLVNNGLITERSLGRMIEISVGPTYSSAALAFSDELEKWSEQIERVADLMTRTNTRSAEIVATALFAAEELEEQTGEQPSEDDVIGAVRAWKRRRQPPPSDTELAEAVRYLGVLGWLELEPSDRVSAEVEELLGV